MRTTIAPVMLLAAACGSSADEGVSDVRSFQQAYVETYCDKHVECCTDDGFDTVFIPTVEETCADPGLFILAGQDLRERVQAGTIRFDAAAATACLNEIERASCDEFAARRMTIADEEKCPGVFTPLVANEAECVMDLECVSGFCEFVSFTGGFCRPAIQEGEACDVVGCAQGLRCALGFCRPVLGPGESFCSRDEQCSTGICQEETCVTTPTQCNGNPAD